MSVSFRNSGTIISTTYMQYTSRSFESPRPYGTGLAAQQARLFTRFKMASLGGLGIPFRLTPQQEEPGSLDDVDRSDSCSYSSGDVPVSDGSSNTHRRAGFGNPSIEETASTASSSNGLPKATKRTRTRCSTQNHSDFYISSAVNVYWYFDVYKSDTG